MVTRQVALSRTNVHRYWLLAGFALVTASVVSAVSGGVGASPILVFAMAPDLAFLAGAGQAVARGQLAPRAVPVYNVLHHPTLPMTIAAASAVGFLSTWWLPAALAWLAHIAFDRAAGYGLRTREGWQRG